MFRTALAFVHWVFVGLLSLSIGIGMIFFGFIAYDGIQEAVFVSRFRDVAGVEHVDHFNYEGGNIATLQLPGGRHLDISGFDFSIFSEAGTYHLDAINDRSLECFLVKDDSTSYIANDFNKVLPLLNLRFEVNNVRDLVAHTDELYAAMQQAFPETSDSGRQVRIGDREEWCHFERFRRRAH